MAACPAQAAHSASHRRSQKYRRKTRTGIVIHPLHEARFLLCVILTRGRSLEAPLAELRKVNYLFNAGHRAINAERFANAKAESYWSLREWMEQGAVCGLNDLETEAQLSSVFYRTTPSGRTEIESKEEGRRRGQASPDRAEAMVLAFWRAVPREQTFVFGDRVEISRI